MKISKKLKIDRVYFHYEDLEEFKAGMWKRLNGDPRRDFVNLAADLMRCPDEFKLAMQQVSKEWPKSCEHNLTCYDGNRIAWLGHAGCCIATGSPEECTRVGWHTLNSFEQDEANRVAAEILAIWDALYQSERKCSKSQLELMFYPLPDSASHGPLTSSSASI